MSLPPIMLFTFGAPGPMMQQSLQDAAARGIDVTPVVLEAKLPDLGKAMPDFWRQIRDTLTGKDEHLVVWTDDALILWDRMERAWNVNHRPDFLWPHGLQFQNGGLSPSESPLYLARGGFEMSLFSFKDLGGFHHMATARAVVKLLTVNPLENFSYAAYLGSIWTNFETVKAPDSWLIRASSSVLDFTQPVVARELDAADREFKNGYRQWQMAREALDAKSRNTLAAAEFVRSNLDIMGTQMQSLAQTMPYYGFWPIRTGRGDFMSLPCSGYHPVVTAHIWLGGYHPLAVDIWNTVFCKDAHTVIDMREDGHFFGLLYLRQLTNGRVTFTGSNLANMTRAQTAIETNNLDTQRVTFMNELPDQKDALLVLHAHQVTQDVWDKHDVFVPIESDNDLTTMRKFKLPTHAALYACAPDKPHIHEIPSLDGIEAAAAVFILNKSRAASLLGRVAL